MGSGIKTVYVVKDTDVVGTLQPSWYKPVFRLASQLEDYFQNPMLDSEFAVVENCVYVLQVRPLVLPRSLVRIPDAEFYDVLCNTESNLKQFFKYDEVLDNMMDWNPAEMIGVQPAPPARSLYELLITDKIAMQSRAALGYRDVSHTPLMCMVAARPFIKASVSFESFIPACVSTDLANKLKQFYLGELKKAPEKHDKVEFEIAFTCFEPDLDVRLESLRSHGFTRCETEELQYGLLQITNNMFAQVDDDLTMVSLLPRKLMNLKHQQHGEPIELLRKIISLTCDFGTLPFANLARCGFVAISLLKSLLRSGHMTERDMDNFMESLNTVSKEIGQDVEKLKAGTMTKDDFLSQYGHLRPGTYDICTPRYDENFDLYFPLKNHPEGASVQRKVEGKYSLDERTQVRVTEYLHKSGLKIDCEQLLEFCKKSIEGREKAKFIFTGAVSDILAQLANLGESFNIHNFDMSFLDIKWLLRERNCNKAHILDNLISNRKQHRADLWVKLPSTILSLRSLHLHEECAVRPNFVTKKCICGDVVTEQNLFASSLEGKIIVVESADPGWDWLFSNNIGALVTCYGGANSHMAIRAAELSLPAAIGVGEVKFKLFASSRTLQIDALSQMITKMR
jgi:phosphohistidine swiveling domain-containing protein